MRTEKHAKFSRAVLLTMGMGLLAGVLIWAKLRLATDIPRSALADPQEQASSEPGADSADRAVKDD